LNNQYLYSLNGLEDLRIVACNLTVLNIDLQDENSIKSLSNLKINPYMLINDKCPILLAE